MSIVSFQKYAQRRRATNETEVTKDEFHSLYYHRLGTKPQRDVLVADFRELDDPNLSMFVSSEQHPIPALIPFSSGSVSRDGRFLFIYVYDRGFYNRLWKNLQFDYI